MYTIIIPPRAQKRLKIIPKFYKRAIKEALNEIKEDPFAGKPLTRELIGRFSFRVGVYRIIYKVNRKDKIIDIFFAGHRAIVYEK